MVANVADIADEGELLLGLAPLHLLLETVRTQPEMAERVRATLVGSICMGLGMMPQSPAARGQQGVPWRDIRAHRTANVELVHFTDNDIEYLPLWTDPNALVHAATVNPQWSGLQPLVLQAKSVVETARCHIILNPWSDWEFVLPPGG